MGIDRDDRDRGGDRPQPPREEHPQPTPGMSDEPSEPAKTDRTPPPPPARVAHAPTAGRKPSSAPPSDKPEPPRRPGPVTPPPGCRGHRSHRHSDNRPPSTTSTTASRAAHTSRPRRNHRHHLRHHHRLLQCRTSHRARGAIASASESESSQAAAGPWGLKQLNAARSPANRCPCRGLMGGSPDVVHPSHRWFATLFARRFCVGRVGRLLVHHDVTAARVLPASALLHLPPLRRSLPPRS